MPDSAQMYYTLHELLSLLPLPYALTQSLCAVVGFEIHVPEGFSEAYQPNRYAGECCSG
ncbi:hypothetical protein ACTXT7_008544 [Hymenolepis weldensis]